MSFLKKMGFNCLSLNEVITNHLLNKPQPEKSFVLTFDDGYVDIYEHALPILEKYGFVATIFVIAEFVKENGKNYLSWQKLRELAKNGFTVGSHALTHLSLSKLDSTAITHELQESKKLIEDQLGQTADLLAYPYGHSNDSIRRIARECGYRAAFGTSLGKYSLFNLWRISVKENENKIFFYLKMRGLYNLFLWIREQTLFGKLTRKWKEGRG
jgi:peptidoglycan/xylan/chitin deacetylase (PgdA/CDA1 family)